MKALVILIVLVGLGIAAVYQFGGFATLDPVAQAAQIRENVKPGMTWEQVCDVRTPRKFYYLDAESMAGESQPQDFDRALMAQLIQNNQVSGGFRFRYNLSADEVIQVDFDGSGTVAAVYEPVTANDLLTGKTWQN